MCKRERVGAKDGHVVPQLHAVQIEQTAHPNREKRSQLKVRLSQAKFLNIAVKSQTVQ